MTAPALAAVRFAAACLTGAVLGLVYGFLRPLRPRLTALADLLFLAAAAAALAHLCFAVCGGDIRLAYGAGAAAGGLAWEWTAGRLLRPLFGGFWKFIGRIWGICVSPVKNLSKYAKNCLHLLENGLQ